MGLNSGEVVVCKIGADLRMDCTAQGRTGDAVRHRAVPDDWKVEARSIQDT
jgi:hypothetical protein